MADKTMYVWSPIVTPDKTFKLGDTITEADIPDDWKYLVEAGSVRPQKYPEHDSGELITRSPTQHLQDQAAKLASGAYVVEPDSPAETPVVEEATKL